VIGEMLKTIFRWIMALFFVAAGSYHFVSPQAYLEIMPPYVPWQRGLVYVSGFAEILLGLAALTQPFRRFAGWGLIALLIAVFPANIHMALDGFHSIPRWILWARLPLQFVLIGWVYWTCVTREVTQGR
jgi:uncharacterized membrane protein